MSAKPTTLADILQKQGKKKALAGISVINFHNAVTSLQMAYGEALQQLHDLLDRERAEHAVEVLKLQGELATTQGVLALERNASATHKEPTPKSPGRLPDHES
jgi:hypothetical protein